MSITQWSEITDIFNLEGVEQENAVHRFLADPHHQAFFRKIASNLCNRYSVRQQMWFDDIHALVQKVAWQILVDPKEHKWARTYSSWAQAVNLGSQNEVRSFVESGDYLGTSGQSTRARRRRMLMALQERMQADGSTPSPQLVVDTHNAAMNEQRADAARQGVLATVEDMAPLGTLPMEFYDDPTQSLPSTGSEADCPLVTTDGVDVIRKLLAEAAKVSDTMARVAYAVYGNALSEPPFIAQPKEAASVCGLSVETVRRTLRDVDGLLRNILADEYGITAANA